MPQQTMAKVRENTSWSLGALVANTAVKVAGPTMIQGGFITTSEIATHITSLTAGEGESLFLGIADKQLSDAEIKESLEAGGPTFKKQDPQADHANRRVRILGQVGMIQSAIVPTNTQIGHWLGKLETRISFSEDNADWSWFVWNLGSTMTTGSTMRVLATHNIRWNA